MRTATSHNRRTRASALWLGVGVWLALAGSAEAALVSQWKLDNNANDSVGANNGTMNGGGTYTTASAPANFVNSHAGSFDGVDDYVSVTDATDPTVYTVGAWVKPSDVTSTSIVVRTSANGPTVNWSHQLRITAASKFEHYLYDGVARSVTGTTTVQANTWYHVVGVASNSGAMRLYVNGVEEGTSVTIGTMETVGDRYFIGSNSGDSMGYFNGSIDDVRLYNHALTATEVATLSERRSPVGYWKLDETTGTSAADSSGLGNTGTHNGGVTISTTVAPTTFSNPRSLAFDGTDDYVDIGPVTNDVNRSEGTVALWALINPVTAFKEVINVRTDGSNEVDLGWVDASGVFRFKYSAGGVNSIVNTTAVTDNSTWRHIAITWSKSADQVKAYVDGSQVGTTQTGLGTWSGAVSVATLGKDPFGDNLNGQIDDARIYNRVLTAHEIADLATTPTTANKRVWDGGGTTTNWSEAANWSNNTLPVSTDTVIFDGDTSNKNCTIDANANVAGVHIHGIMGEYTGTITQAAGITVTVGSSGWDQAGGTFTGGNSTIDINGTYTLSGGTFTSTSGTLAVGRQAASETVFTVATGATFTHNSGTVSYDSASANYSGTNTFTVDVPTTLTLNHLVVNIVPGTETTTSLTTATGDTVIAAGNFTHTDGILAGTWEVQGNVTINAGADGGTGTLTFTGTATSTYAYTAGGRTCHLRVNKSSGTVTPAGGTTALNVSLFTLTAGSFTAPSGTFSVGRSNASSETVFTVATGATFTHNSGTVSFDSASAAFSGTNTFTVDVPTSLTVNHLVVNIVPGAETTTSLTTATGDTVIAAGNFTHTDGILAGIWEVQGNLTVGAAADGGTATLTFSGTANQTYTDNGGNEVDGDLTINKTAGTATLASNADWNAAGQDLTLTAGTLDQGASFNLTTGAVTIGAGGTLKNLGTGDLTLGGTLDNSGTVTLTAGASCAGLDDILIRSSTGGTQRTWQGSGTFTLRDLDVQDMAKGVTPATLTCQSCTNTLNNTGWTFGGATAGTIGWDGGGTGNNWSEAANWCGNTIPAAGQDVVFNATSVKNATVDSIVNNLASLSVNTGYTGTITFAVDAITNQDLTLTGNFNVNAGTVVLTGKTTTTDSNDAAPGNGINDGRGWKITAANMTIASGASVHANGKGFGAAAGPGAAGAYGEAGTHGGIGGNNADATYGSLTDPKSLGSGGWGSGAGGGAIILSSSGTITVNGTLSADGTNGGAAGEGGGTGGSVNLTAATLTGTGTIRANGGNGAASGVGSSGGGGRISLNGVTTDNFSGTLQANGGTATGRGFAGTTYLNAGKRSSLTLGGAGNLASLRLGSDGTNNYTFTTITIQSGGTLELDGNPNMNTSNGGAATLTVTTLDIQSGGVLKADALGFESTKGPGGGAAYGEGGTHGGVGGGNADATYGSMTNPVNLGSGANYITVDFSRGGGAVIISSTGTVTVNGTLSADGQIGSGGGGAGGGAGGTINITAGTLAGSGTIRANGGNGNSQAGGGGGGRISLNGVTTDSFTGTLQAYGATANNRGFAGTVYLNSAKRTTLTLGGAGNLTSLRLGSDGTNNYTFTTITIQSGGTLEIDGNRNMNSPNGGAATLTVTTLDIQSGGVLKADGLGFEATAGPGGGGAWGEGGTHGGAGGGNADATYGSFSNPVNLGSGGYYVASLSSRGGGAVIISSSGTVTVNGTLSANGEDGSGGGGSGGAGGSINITAATLTGSGTIRANGAVNGTNGGGGGRIAARPQSLQSFTVSFNGTMTVSAGTGGGAGTIYIPPTVSSAANQSFSMGQAATAISTITITNRAYVTTGTVIGATNDLRIKIPSGFNMVWDSTDTTATIGGAQSAKVSTTVTYEDTNKTLVVNVTTDFAASDQITVSGLSFTTFSAASSADNLELEILNDNATQAEDDKTIEILSGLRRSPSGGVGYPAIY